MDLVSLSVLPLTLSEKGEGLMSEGTGRYAVILFVTKSRRRQIAVTMEHKSGNIGNWKSGLYPTEI